MESKMMKHKDEALNYCFMQMKLAQKELKEF